MFHLKQNQKISISESVQSSMRMAQSNVTLVATWKLTKKTND